MLSFSVHFRTAILALLIVQCQLVVAQTKVIPTDSTIIETVEKDSIGHSPKKAAIMSALLPGLGQIYNRKYWKLPIIYAGIGTSAFFIGQNTVEYNYTRDQYLIAIEEKEGEVDPFFENATPDQIRAQVEQYQNWRELSIVITGLIYVLNIVDASVDAHLYEFDVSDDLSLRWEPKLIHTNMARHRVPGIGFTLRLK